MRALLSFLSYRQANPCNFLLYASPLLAYHSILPLGQAFFMLPACLHSLLASQACNSLSSRLPALAFGFSSKRFSRFPLAYIRFLPLKQAFFALLACLHPLFASQASVSACLEPGFTSQASNSLSSRLPALAFGFSSKRFSSFSLAYIRFLPLKQAFFALPACLHSLLVSQASVSACLEPGFTSQASNSLSSRLPALAFGFSSKHFSRFLLACTWFLPLEQPFVTPTTCLDSGFAFLAVMDVTEALSAPYNTSAKCTFNLLNMIVPIPNTTTVNIQKYTVEKKSWKNHSCP